MTFKIAGQLVEFFAFILAFNFMPLSAFFWFSVLLGIASGLKHALPERQDG